MIRCLNPECFHGDPGVGRRGPNLANAFVLQGPYASSFERRFWSKVRKSDGCWEWAGRMQDGYGSTTFANKRFPAHRISYILTFGDVPTSLVIDHLCRNKRCVNPAHLEPVSLAENTLRGYGPTAENKRKTHCKHGHPLEGDNLIRSGKARKCRVCLRAAQRAYKVRLRERHP